MELIQFALEFLKDPLTILNLIIADHGTLIYVFLFLIIFMETGIVVLPFLPGDSLLFAIGLLAGTTGGIEVHKIIPLLVVAALLGDNLNYFIGRKFGNFVQSREKVLFLKREHITKTEKYFRDNGPKTIILARFIPIIRTVAPFVAGTAEMKYKTYLTFCVIGAIFWVSSIILLGYKLGEFPIVKNNFSKAVLVIVFISFIPLVLKFFKKKQKV
jgi:membrane-associated protein